MTDLLRRVGEALYGPRWQTDLAQALAVNDRTVRRWVSGDDPPQGVYDDLARIMSDRAGLLNALVAECARSGADARD